jgi:hypothetical protein
MFGQMKVLSLMEKQDDSAEPSQDGGIAQEIRKRVDLALWEKGSD